MPSTSPPVRVKRYSESNIVRNNAGRIVGSGTPISYGGDYIGASTSTPQDPKDKTFSGTVTTTAPTYSSARPSPVQSQGTTLTPTQASNTINPATNRPYGSTISAGKPLSDMAGTYHQSYWDATKQSTRNLGTNIWGGFTGGQTNWAGTFQPFKYTGSEKSEQIAFYKPQYGTTQYTFDSATNSLVPTPFYKPVTFLDVQKESEMFRGLGIETARVTLTGEGQKRVNAGEDIQKVTEDINKRFTSTQEDLWKKYPNVQGFTTRTGEGLVTGIPAVLETGALIGASTLGGPVGVGVASAYTFGRGFQQTVESPTLGGKALGVATIGLSGFGVGGAFTSVERTIVRGELASRLSTLSGSKIKFTQLDMPLGGRGAIRFTAVQRGAGLTRTIQGKGLYISSPKGSFIMPGEYTSITSGEALWNIYGKSSTKFVNVDYGKYFMGGKGAFSPKLGVTTFITKSQSQQTMSLSALYGVNKPAGSIGKIGKYSTSVDISKGAMQRTSSLGFSKEITPDLFGNQRYFAMTKSVAGGRLTSPKQIGFITVMNKPSTGGGFSGGFGGGLSKPQITKQFSTGGIAGTIGKNKVSLNNLFKTSPVSSTATKGGIAFRGLTSESSYKTMTVSKTTTIPGVQGIGKLVSPTVKTTTTTIPGVTSIGKLNVIPTTKIAIIETQIPKPNIPTTQITKFPTFGTPNRIIPRIPTPSVPTFIPPFAFGKPSPSGSFGKMRDIFGKRSFKYTPSYGALVFGIKGAKPSKTKFTGLEVRPIVFSKKRRKKRNKK